MKNKIKYILTALLLISLTWSANSVTLADTTSYQALEESSQSKIIADRWGNLYFTFVDKYNGFPNPWVYVSYNSGKSWSPLGDGLPVAILDQIQRNPSIAVDNNKGYVYCFWAGCDTNYAGTFYYEDLDKHQPGDTQVKFAAFKDGKWTAWQNISPVEAYATWLSRSNLNDPVSLELNPVIGNKLKIVKYYQASPSAVVDSRGVIHVAWYGGDANHTGMQIKYSYSADYGESWSTWTNIAPQPDAVVGGSNLFFAQVRPRIIADTNNRIYIFYEYQDQTMIFSGSRKQYQKIAYVYSDDLFQTYSGPHLVTTEEKIEKFVDVTLGADDGLMHVVFSGQVSGYDSQDARQIRYATVDRLTPTSVSVHAGYIAETKSWEQKWPQVTLDHNDLPIVLWGGNDAAYPVYDGGDPGTENLTIDTNSPVSVPLNSENPTGYFTMYSRFNGASWSAYEVLGPGYYASALKEAAHKGLLFGYMEEEGDRYFTIKVGWEDIDRFPDYSHEPLPSLGELRVQLLPNPLEFGFGHNLMVAYELSVDSEDVEVGIANTLGQKVCVLVKGARTQGTHLFSWNGHIGHYSAQDDETVGDPDRPMIGRGAYVVYIRDHVSKVKNKSALYVR